MRNRIIYATIFLGILLGIVIQGLCYVTSCYVGYPDEPQWTGENK